MPVQIKGVGSISGLDQGIVVGIVTSSTQINVGSNIKFGSAGIATASNFKTGSSNLHSTGLTVGNNFLHTTGINVGTGATIHVPASNTLTFGTNSNERLRIASDGTITASGTGELKLISATADNTNKNCILLTGHYDTAEEDYSGVIIRSDNGDNTTFIGGGLSGYNSATKIRFYTSPNQTTTTGTERFRINPLGQLISGGYADPYPTRSLTVQSVTGQTNTYISIVAGNTSSVSGITFGDASGQAAGNYAGMFEYRHNDDSLRYLQNASEKLRITSGGNLAIGNASPQQLLHVWPDTANTTSAYVRVTSGDRGSGTGIDLGSDADGDGRVNVVSNANLKLYTNNTERLRITSAGRVGINETSPDALLHLSTGASTTCELRLTANNTGSGAGDRGRINVYTALNNGTAYQAGYVDIDRSSGTDDIAHLLVALNDGSSVAERIRITGAGQLLLGETSAFDSNTAIQFRKDNSGNTADFVFRNRANNSSSRVQIKLSTLNRAANADVVAGIEKYQSGGMHFYNGENTNQYAQMAFFNNGWPSLRLRNGNHSGYDVAHISGYWGTSNALMIEQGGPQSGTFKAIRFTTSHYGGERGYIGVTLGGTSYNSSSDYRMKQDVVDLTGAIDRVKSFKPRRFKWKEDPTYTVDGFLAHEASTVVPESVDGEKDAVDSNGDPKYQVMDNSRLVPVLTAALKEAITKIEEASAKIETLEQDNIALRARVTNLEGN